MVPGIWLHSNVHQGKSYHVFAKSTLRLCRITGVLHLIEGIAPEIPSTAADLVRNREETVECETQGQGITRTFVQVLYFISGAGASKLRIL